MIDIQKEINVINEKWKSSDLKVLNEKIWSEEVLNEIVEHPLFKEIYTEDVINSKLDQLLNCVPNGKETKIYCVTSWMNSYVKKKRLVNANYNMKNGATCSSPTIEEYDEPTELALTLVAYTEEMIEVDYEFFKPSEDEKYSVLDLIYKPYSYALDIDLSDPYYSQILKEPNGCYCFSIVPLTQDSNCSQPVRMGHIWKAASPEENYPVEIKCFRRLGYFNNENGDDTDRDIEEKINHLNDVLIGYLDNIPDDLIDNEPVITAQFGKMFDPSRRYTATVLRVGQANAVVFDDDNYRFAFDLGLPLYCFRVFENGEFNSEKTGYRNNDDLKIKDLNLNSVVISHWHDDHYLGMFSLKRSFFIGGKAGIVLAPLYRKNTKLAYRLVAYLIKRKRILFIKRECYIQNSKAEENCVLFRLCDKKDINNDSLLLLMNNTLFPGDCFHDRWESIVNNCPKIKGRVENMLVIHHGSNIGNPIQKSNYLEAVLSVVRHKAIICVGNNKSETEGMNYHHPDNDVIQYYKNLGFEQVIRTDSDTEDENLFKIQLY